METGKNINSRSYPSLASDRRKARTEKRYDDADAIRDQIILAGYDLKDTPKGPEITLRSETKTKATKS